MPSHTEDRAALLERLSSSSAATLLEAGTLLLVAEGYCPTCGDYVTGDWDDQLSRREYLLSGLCQSCQDTLFREESTDPGLFEAEEEAG